MKLPGWGFRTVRLEHKAQQAHDAALKEFDRYEDAYLGLEWLLCRKPEVGQLNVVEGAEWWLHVQESDYLAETPMIWVLYKVSAEDVQIFDLKIFPYAADEND